LRGVPALNAARTALICPRVNEIVANSVGCRWKGDLSVRDEQFVAWSRQSAAPPHFLEGCRVEQIQFAVAQVLDSFTQVLWKHMSLRGRVGWYLCGRYRLYWRRRTVSARLGREQVWCRLLTAIASHGGGSCRHPDEGAIPPAATGPVLIKSRPPTRLHFGQPWSFSLLPLSRHPNLLFPRV
jgi:hypothetical protein